MIVPIPLIYSINITPRELYSYSFERYADIHKAIFTKKKTKNKTISTAQKHKIKTMMTLIFL